MYNIAVCDNDKSICDELTEFCEDILNEDGIEHSITQFMSADEFEREANSFDLVLLDIEMDDRNGFEMAKEMRRFGNKISIIFVSGHEDYLRHGYSVQPVHFLLKPVKRDALAEAVAADIRLNHSNDDIVLYSGMKTMILPIDKFVYAESYNHSILVHMTESVRFLRMSLTELDRQLEPYTASRCHNSYIVNLRYIAEFNRKGIITVTGEKLPVGRKYYNDLKSDFVKYMNR